MIIGGILASGSSTRMGAPKALLEIGGVTFLKRIAMALDRGGCERVVAVIGGPHIEALRIACESMREPLLTVIENRDPSEGPISSIRTLLADEVATDVDWAVLHPVDIPGVEPADVRALTDGVARWKRVDAVKLRVGGRGAHPVAVSTRLAPHIDRASSLREVLRGPDADVREIDHDAPLLLADVDTPEDLERFRRLYNG